MRSIAQFASVLVRMVDPRLNEDDLVALIQELDADEIKDALVALAAVHSICVEAAASRLAIDTGEYLRRLELAFADNLYAAERLNAEGGMIL